MFSGFEGNMVLEEFDSNVGLRQDAHYHHPYNLFIDGFIYRLDEAITQPPVINQRQAVCLLFVDDLAVGAMTLISLQWAVNCVNDFCKEWGSKVM